MDSKNTSPYANPQPLPEKPAYNTYVGARYVPIYDGAWSSRKKYEPLVVVQYQGNSYTSKTYVPAGVNPTNENYWAQSGNYNAQVEEYRREVNELKTYVDGEINELTTLVNGFNNRITANSSAITLINSWQKYMNLFTNKNVAIFGDSLSDGNRTGTTWSRTFKTLVESVGGTVDNYAHSGDTIARTVIAVNGVTKYYDIVIVWIGINDWSTSTPIGTFKNLEEGNTFISRYNTIIRHLLTLNRPKIILCGLHQTHRTEATGKQVSEYEYSKAIKGTANRYGCGFIDMFALPNVGWGSPVSAWSEDGLHFTKNYQDNYLLPFLIEGMCGAQYADIGQLMIQYNGIIRAQEAFLIPEEGWTFTVEIMNSLPDHVDIILSFHSVNEIAAGARVKVATWHSLIWGELVDIGATNRKGVVSVDNGKNGAMWFTSYDTIQANLSITTNVTIHQMSNVGWITN
jgi:hypothetical protein